MIDRPRGIVVVVAAVILVMLNFNIYQKEKILETGVPVYFKLAPVDPRSLIQGDYMRLNYEITDQFRFSEEPQDEFLPYLVFKLDEDNVAVDGRRYRGEELQEGERLVHLQKSGLMTIIPSSFFFQEGFGKYYEAAKYGVFKFASNDEYVLFGLADENRKLLGPPE